MGNCMITRRETNEANGSKILLQKGDYNSLVQTAIYGSQSSYLESNETPYLFSGQAPNGTSITCAIKNIDAGGYSKLNDYVFCKNNNTSNNRYYVGLASSENITNNNLAWNEDISSYITTGAIFHTECEVFSVDLNTLSAEQKKDLNLYFKACGGYVAPGIWVYPILVELV